MTMQTVTIHCQTCGRAVRFHQPFGGELPAWERYCNQHGREPVVEVVTAMVAARKSKSMRPASPARRGLGANLLKCIRRT